MYKDGLVEYAVLLLCFEIESCLSVCVCLSVRLSVKSVGLSVKKQLIMKYCCAE